MENKPNYHIVSCSGASNTGKYSDEVARKLMHNGEAKMLCLARFAIDKPWAENVKKDIGKLIVLDGCPINCAEKTMIESGINDFTHINTTNFDIVKGKRHILTKKPMKLLTI